jgi:hypothetical protein
LLPITINYYMKKFFLSIIITVVSVVALVGSVHAINLGGSMLNNAGSRAGYADATTTSFAEILGGVVKVALSFVGVIFLLLMVYAGYLWMTARGDEGQVEKAETIIRSSIIGIVITTAAYSIAAFVLPAILSRTTGGALVDVGSDPTSIGTCSYTTGSAVGPTRGSQTNVTETSCRATCASLGVASSDCTWTVNSR